MFFRKKAKADPAPFDAEHRAQYRKSCAPSQPLEATLCAKGLEPLRVELIDLTVRGAGIRVPYGKHRRLKPDEVVELRITCMMRNEVITGARVANVGSDTDQHVRYGLEFLSLGALYSQLDSFYARHFNRRQAQRMAPAFDRKIHATLTWPGGQVRAQVVDLSVRGIAVALGRDDAEKLAEIENFEVAFKLPDGGDCKGAAAIRHRTPLSQQTVLGLEFDLAKEGGMRRQAAAIRGFVERRAAEVAMWEKKLGSRELR
jgi:c-di-GMP-binding flagellar brake protein YcgR